MTSVRQLLKRNNIRPRKRLGQSFLEDLNIVRKIAALSNPSGDETVVEIGAGLGLLTEELAKGAGRVVALEIDPRLIAVLRDRFSGNDRVEIVAGDVLDYDFSSPCPGGRIKVVGNIPYHISSPILFRLIAFRRSISSMLLMFQKELADRIMASPGKKDYGIPSVMIGRYAIATEALTVPPTCFYPVPEVVSSVLRIVIHEDQHPLADATFFLRTVRAAFSHRRKTLWNNLRAAGFPVDTLNQVLAEAGIKGDRRAETLSVDEFGLLAAGLAGSGNADE